MLNLKRLSQTCDLTWSVLSRPILISHKTPILTSHKTPVISDSCQSVRGLHQEAPDYYGILGVHKNATLAEVKLAYFNMAKKFHPDTNKTLDARQVFSLIAEAYDVLSDPKRRAKYDDTGLGEEKFGGRAGGPGRQTTDSSYTSEEMYQRIFGDNRARAGAETGDPGEREGEVHQDYAETYAGSETTKEYIAKISFEEAFLGTTIQIQYKYVGTCIKVREQRGRKYDMNINIAVTFVINLFMTAITDLLFSVRGAGQSWATRGMCAPTARGRGRRRSGRAT